MKEKTAIDTFLEQIVLKQVKGSVYLCPAITDIQIEESKALFRQQIIDAVNATEIMIARYDSSEKIQLHGEQYYNEKFTPDKGK